MDNEKRLARRMAQGDPRAFEEFVDRYGGRIHRLVRRYVACASDAEDVTQEIFVDLYRGIAGFRGEAALGTWVYRIALNHCLKQVGRARPDTVPLDDALQAQEDPAADPERHAVRSELGERVQGALNGLTAAHRDVVILHEMHGFTYNECARILDVPVGTVKSRLSNAFGRLREALGGYVLGEGSGLAPCPDTITEMRP